MTTQNQGWSGRSPAEKGRSERGARRVQRKEEARAELRAHRTRRGWTQVELGAKIGYSGCYVSDVERGDKGATDDFAKRCDSKDAFDLPGMFLRLWEDLQRESFPT